VAERPSTEPAARSGAKSLTPSGSRVISPHARFLHPDCDKRIRPLAGLGASAGVRRGTELIFVRR
jgi:hypothetical protein